MSPTSSFALLSLPFVALTEVIKKMKLKELFQLSFCLKKTHFIAKHCRDKPIKLEFALHGGRRVVLDLFEPNDTDVLELNINRYPESPPPTSYTLKLEGRILLVRDDLKDGFDVYCENIQRETNSLIQYVSHLFNKKLDFVFFLKRSYWMMGMVEKLQGSLYEACIRFDYGQKEDAFTDQEFRDVLIFCKAIDLYIEHSPSNTFRFDNFDKRYNRLFICNAHWITSENLFSLDCQELYVCEKGFTSQEVGQFLKHWIEGGAPRLKVLSVEVNNSSQDEIFSNIEEYIQTISGQRKYKVTNNTWTFDGNLVRRMDGVMASIQYFPSNKRVRLAAWPDFQGNSF